MDIITSEIVNCLKQFFYREAFILALLVLLSLIAIIVSIYEFRCYLKKSIIKAILLVSLTCVCALTLIIMGVVDFLPVYTDYRKMDYIIEQNAEICIIEGTNNIWEQKNMVQVKTQNGESLELEIVNDYKFETGVVFKGEFVYTKRSKHIIWYKFTTKTDEFLS